MGAAAGGLGAAFLLRRLRQTPAPVPAPAPAGPDPRAEELRAKLAEARKATAEEEAVAEPEPTPEDDVPVAPPADEFEAMRRRVHDEARAAAREMRGDEEDGADEPPA